ncbi:hypothetical protein [Chryseobacterium geocarposphaerae]|uniref:Uncharacterized protein n=1 Tax=Chryseobacterium geocarposphaerae TaxID=1416776 RepID=A0A2M9C9C3_9FLAO|nr:hypothetical protein [Chryseobacterium geocarposphaerae]PJJ67439.1 hypothetical protein CLV73_1452 [Chryseobacterium geocarposphaerae]
MNSKKILKTLKRQCFIKIPNHGELFNEGASIYAKEIDRNIFLVFVIEEDADPENVQALIAQFDSLGSIGKKEPIKTMFYMSFKDNEDMHYFEKFIHISENR